MKVNTEILFYAMWHTTVNKDFSGLNPAFSVGDKVTFGCKPGYSFHHDFYAAALVTLTCTSEGSFEGVPRKWPRCVNRE